MVARLFQIVYLLMERDSMTAKELADKLEVSVRTINRDIEKLSEARIPIYATRGRGGGISLLSDFVLNKKVLTEEEKSSILSSMKVLGTVACDAEKQALSRLEDFFGEVAQDWIEIELDTWNEGNFDRDRFRQLKGAILSHKKLSFDYMKKGVPEFRTIRPCKLVFRAQAWYLYGFCEKRQDFRYFKLHRMAHLIVLEERFDPLVLPKEEPRHYLVKEPAFAVKILVQKCMAYRIYDELPASAIIERKEGLVCTISNARESWFYDYILSYGPYARVIEPEEIQNKVHTMIKEMKELYDKELYL